MDTKRTRELPDRLDRLRQRFEEWRQTRKIPSRIPEPLWAAAARMTGTYGISRIANMLRINYSALKRRADKGAAGGERAVAAGWHPAAAGEPKKRAAFARGPRKRAGGQGNASTPAFLELAPPSPLGVCQCTLELEDRSGAKMRVHLQGAETPDLAALSRSFWNSGP